MSGREHRNVLTIKCIASFPLLYDYLSPTSLLHLLFVLLHVPSPPLFLSLSLPFSPSLFSPPSLSLPLSSLFLSLSNCGRVHHTDVDRSLEALCQANFLLLRSDVDSSDCYRQVGLQRVDCLVLGDPGEVTLGYLLYLPLPFFFSSTCSLSSY